MAEINYHIDDVYMIANDTESIEAIRKITNDIRTIYCEGRLYINNEPGYDASTMLSYIPIDEGIIPKCHMNTLWKVWCVFDAILPYFIPENNRKISQYANTEQPGSVLNYLIWKSALDTFRKNIGRGTRCNDQLKKAGMCLFKKNNLHPITSLFGIEYSKLERIINLIDLSIWMRRHLFDDQIETSTDSINGNKFIDFRNGVLTIKATY